jgi:tyrosyl-tRNA synthetase
MYGKIMSISDDMMWRYYELLTDLRTDQIAQMKQDAARGKAHPMALKKELARSIVADFHSPDAATKAAEDWAKQFQKNEAPESLPEVTIDITKIRIADVVPDSDEGGTAQNVSSNLADIEILRADKLIREAGFVASTTEASRRVKERAVHINGHIVERLAIRVCPAEPLIVRVGKKIKKIIITGA